MSAGKNRLLSLINSWRQKVTGLVTAGNLPILIVFLCLYLPFCNRYGWDYRDKSFVDLPSFYTASISVFSHGESPYNLTQLQSIMPDEEEIFPYLYPPPSLLFFYPLSIMNYETARVVVLCINHLLILVLLWIIPSIFLRDTWMKSMKYFIAFAYIINFYPLRVTLFHGQVNLLLALFLVLFWTFARSKNSIWASLFLSLAILLKSYPIILLPMLFIAGRKRDVGYTVAWLGLAVVISLIVMPITLWHDWLHNVLLNGGYMRNPEGLPPLGVVWNQSLNGFLARIYTKQAGSLQLSETFYRIMAYFIAGVLAIISGFAVWLSKRNSRCSELDKTMLVSLPLMYMIAPFSWDHHLVYLLPVILLLMTRRTRFSRWRALLYYAIILCAASILALKILYIPKFFGVLMLWVLSVGGGTYFAESPEARVVTK